jgi:chromosome segregation protein
VAKDEQNLILVEKAKLDTRLESLNKEIVEAFGSIPESLAQYKKAHTEANLPNQISKFKHQLELAGGVDESTMMEYRETQERFDYLSNQSEDLNKAVVDLRSVIEELDQIIKTQFDEAFDKISTKFSEYFRILFNGGSAKMALLKESEMEIDEEELDESKPVVDGLKKKKSSPVIVGIEIKATPPGKKLATIAALSGGERALTAIALLCSMLASYPSPFVVLDEVDAALDEANSIRFGKILSTLVHQTQFIAITHNRETMRQAHTLYGVTMSDEGISKILSLKLEQAEKIEVK